MSKMGRGRGSCHCCTYQGPYFEVATTTLVDDTPDPDEVRIVGRSTITGLKSFAVAAREFALVDANIPANADIITTYNHAWARWTNDAETQVTYARITYGGAVASMTFDIPYGLDGTPDPDDPTADFDDWVAERPVRMAFEHLEATSNLRASGHEISSVGASQVASASVKPYNMSAMAVVDNGTVIIPRAVTNVRAYSNIAADYYYAVDQYDRVEWNGSTLDKTAGYASYDLGSSPTTIVVTGEDRIYSRTPSSHLFGWVYDDSLDWDLTYAFRGTLDTDSDEVVETDVIGTYTRSIFDESVTSDFSTDAEGKIVARNSRDSSNWVAGINVDGTDDLYVNGTLALDSYEPSSADPFGALETYYETHDIETEWPPPDGTWPSGDNELDDGITDLDHLKWYDTGFMWARPLDNTAGSDVVMCFEERSVTTGTGAFGATVLHNIKRKRLEFWSGGTRDLITYSAARQGADPPTPVMLPVLEHGNFFYVEGSLWHFPNADPPVYFAISNDGACYFDCQDTIEWWEASGTLYQSYGIPYSGSSLPDWAEPPIDFSELEVNPTP